jgi:hypothetical protein
MSRNCFFLPRFSVLCTVNTAGHQAAAGRPKSMALIAYFGWFEWVHEAWIVNRVDENVWALNKTVTTISRLSPRRLRFVLPRTVTVSHSLLIKCIACIQPFNPLFLFG